LPAARRSGAGQGDLAAVLKEWLDQNLPQLVERYVEREIVRLTRR
jgi:cell pole-organizing protein PopZ